MNTLDEIADAEHKIKKELAEWNSLERIRYVALRSEKSKRLAQLRVNEVEPGNQKITLREREYLIDEEIATGEGECAGAWQMWNGAQVTVEKLEAQVQWLRHLYWTKREQTRVSP